MAYGWEAYVPVATRREQAKKAMQKMRKEGAKIYPVEINGRKIAKSFWGAAWCDHLEQFSDYENRLPRGRTYVRNGSVCHLEIKQGEIEALVSGSSLYHIKITIKPLPAAKWKAIKHACMGQIGSMLELLQGKLSDEVMSIVTDLDQGLFPKPKDIQLDCDCPDIAVMCKHVAAVLYGVGAHLDHHPELLFLLRQVDHLDLISADIKLPSKKSKQRKVKGDLSDLFGIDLDEAELSPPKVAKPKSRSVQKKTVRPLNVKQKVIRPSGKSVIRLRKRFGMNNTQFARLVGVSTACITLWENQPQRLNLRPESLQKLSVVVDLDKAQAWARLGSSA